METKTKKEIKLPFSCDIIDKEPVKITNPFSGESCMLTPEAVAVYDVIIGANRMAEAHDSIKGYGTSPSWKLVRKGLNWFRRHYAKEYMVLLD